MQDDAGGGDPPRPPRLLARSASCQRRRQSATGEPGKPLACPRQPPLPTTSPLASATPSHHLSSHHSTRPSPIRTHILPHPPRPHSRPAQPHPQVRALHAQNADLLHYDERGFNSLHHAAVGAHEDIVLYLLQTPQGAALCNQSTAESGALSAWLPAQVAASERIRQQLLDFAQGGDEARRRLIQFARKKLRIQQRGGLEAQ